MTAASFRHRRRPPCQAGRSRHPSGRSAGPDGWRRLETTGGPCSSPCRGAGNWAGRRGVACPACRRARGAASPAPCSAAAWCSSAAAAFAAPGEPFAAPCSAAAYSSAAAASAVQDAASAGSAAASAVQGAACSSVAAAVAAASAEPAATSAAGLRERTVGRRRHRLSPSADGLRPRAGSPPRGAPHRHTQASRAFEKHL